MKIKALISCVQLLHSLSAPLFSPMQNVGFLIRLLMYFLFVGIPRLVQLCSIVDERNNSDAVLVASLVRFKKKK